LVRRLRPEHRPLREPERAQQPHRQQRGIVRLRQFPEPLVRQQLDRQRVVGQQKQRQQDQQQQEQQQQRIVQRQPPLTITSSFHCKAAHPRGLFHLLSSDAHERRRDRDQRRDGGG